MDAKPVFHYLIPGLSDVVKTDSFVLSIDQFSALNRVLSRSASYESLDDFPHLLAKLFDCSIASNEDVPVAALTSQKDVALKDLKNTVWLVASPVILKPDRDRLVLHSAALSEGDHDIALLCDKVKKHFDSDFADIFINDRGEWVIRLFEEVSLQTTPVNEVVGRNIEPFMPRGKSAKKWHSIMNEIQMLFHECDSMKFGFNALWFHGVGRLPIIKKQNLFTMGSDALLSGLEKLSKATKVNKLSEIRDKGDIIAVEQGVMHSICLRSETVLIEKIRQINVTIREAFHLLLVGKIASIRLYAFNDKVYEFKRHHYFSLHFFAFFIKKFKLG